MTVTLKVPQYQAQNEAQPLSPVQTSEIKSLQVPQVTVDQPTQVSDWNDSYAGYDYPVDYGSHTEGPLSDLYKNPYKQNALYYPKDLGFLDKGHSVQFDIRDIVPVQTGWVKNAVNEINSVMTNEDSLVKQATDEAAAAFKKGLNAAGQAITNPLSTYEAVSEYSSTKSSKIAGTLKDQFKKIYNNGNPNLNPQLTKSPIDTIRLYMPDSLQFDYNAQYDKLSLAEAINSVPLVGKISTAITGFLESNKLAQAVQKKVGYTFNPQQQTIFEGIDFREFQMEFIFTPTSQAEAVQVQQIITKLRRAAAPTKQTDLAGFFWVPPSVFDISFFFNRQINYSIPPIRQCVLQSISVNYAPNGWAAMKDGSPVQTAITLSFREMDLVDRNSILQEKQLTIA